MFKLPKIDLNKLCMTAWHAFEANKATVYATLASIGVIGTGVTAAKAAIKTKEFNEEFDDATIKEKATYYARVWITPVVVGGVTIFCIWRGEKIHLEREASLAAMGAYWKKKHDELAKKVEEKLGEEGAKEIKEEIFRERMDSGAELPTGKIPDGAFWVYDELTDQFILTDPQRFNWALYTINQQFAAMQDVDYNTFLVLIGGKADPKIRQVGWSFMNDGQIETMQYNGLGMWIEITPEYYSFRSKNKEIDGVQAAALEFNYPPEYFFNN